MHDNPEGRATPLGDWEAKLEAEARRRFREDDGSHDLAHVRRVWKLSRRMADEVNEPVDLLVLLAASYFHDAIVVEKNDPRRSQASRLAAEFARELLGALGFPPAKLDPVAHAIEAHSFSAAIPPRTIEAKLLQDADRMEALGAVGIARTFYVAGRIGSRLFHTQDPLGRSRSLDDNRYALDHFFTKLLALPDTMTTAPGRMIAAQRAASMRRFIEELLQEIDP